MADARILFLVGMPAAGKTFWGRKLAEEYHLAFTDLDGLIADREKANIPALFAAHGEEVFRQKETAALTELIGSVKVSTIIACGGGTPCFNDNMQIMKQAGVVVYLEADISQLLENIDHSTGVRPLLAAQADVPAYLQQLLQQRRVFYEGAHYILQTKDISLTTFAEIIASCTNRR